MKVRLSEDAEQQAEVCDLWWREHRKDSPSLFAHELAATRAQLSSTPKIGVVWAVVRGNPVRRFLMPRTRHHIYYEIDVHTGDVYVHAIWGAPKEHGPKL